MKLLFAFALGLASSGMAQIPPPNDAGVSTGHIHLNVKDAAVQKKFWMDHFDAIALKKEGLSGVKVPGTLILFKEGPSTGSSEGTVMDHFGFRVRDIQAELKSFRAEGYPVLREFTGAEGFPNAYIMGPDKVKIEMQEDKTLPVRASVNHLHFYAKDIESLRGWYVTNFGAHSRKRGTLDVTADISTVNLSFMLMKPEDSIAGTKGRSIDHIGFEVKNLEAFCKKLQANGIKLDTPYTKVAALGVGYAYLTDPAGTYIELTEGLTQF
jgi:catechol 2,3-dioxygenase-like lactoylglutathione lyase family enzyme